MMKGNSTTWTGYVERDQLPERKWQEVVAGDPAVCPILKQATIPPVFTAGGKGWSDRVKVRITLEVIP